MRCHGFAHEPRAGLDEECVHQLGASGDIVTVGHSHTAVPTSILVADEHPAFCEGIAHALSQELPGSISTHDGIGRTLVDVVRSDRTELLVLGLPAACSAEAITSLCSSALAGSTTRCLLLADSSSNVDVGRFLELGVSGLLSKSASLGRVVQAVVTVLGGDCVIDAMHLGQVSEFVDHGTTGEGVGAGLLARLTPREREILASVCRGWTNRQISRALGVSPKTVANHMSSILSKLNIADRTQAVLLVQGIRGASTDASSLHAVREPVNRHVRRLTPAPEPGPESPTRPSWMGDFIV